MQHEVSVSKTPGDGSILPESSHESRDTTVHVLVRAFGILDVFARSSAPSLSVTEVATQMHLHKSTVHRLLTTLERIGYVAQDEATQRYRLGLKILDLAASVTSKIDIREQALPVMERLVQTAQETVHLGTLMDGEVVCIESIASSRPVALMRLVGKRGPAHVSSMGKVLLAGQPEDTINQIIAEKGLVRLTEQTITDPEKFRSHLRTIREAGWATNTGEEEPGIGCVAAPIRNRQREIVAALSIAAPSIRLAGENLERLVGLAIDSAREISESLGYSSA